MQIAAFVAFLTSIRHFIQTELPPRPAPILLDFPLGAAATPVEFLFTLVEIFPATHFVFLAVVDRHRRICINNLCQFSASASASAWASAFFPVGFRFARVITSSGGEFTSFGCLVKYRRNGKFEIVMKLVSAALAAKVFQ